MFRNSSNVILKYINYFYKKIFIVVIVIVTLFIITGVLTTTKPSTRLSSSIFASWTGNIESSLFIQLFSMENNTFHLFNDVENNRPKMTETIFNLLTSIKMTDMKSFLSNEIPGFSTYENKIIIAGEGISEIDSYVDESGPPLENVLQERKAIAESEKEKESEKKEQSEKPVLSTDGREVVFIYSTHNRESFLPHLPEEENANNAYHDEVNITKVGERIAKSLDENGIGTNVDSTDFMNVLNEKGWSYWRSYDASRPVVQEAISQNEHIQYIFDIHRDSLPRDKTTKKINGKNYAKVLFVIGAENKNYENNLKLATKFHNLLKEKYPGLSKGVITKEGPSSNGVYNQDLNENTLLMEIGGYENTLEEMYLTADVIAELFSEFYWEAEKVSK